ncbi:MAG TPA: ATP-dependent protease ATPase subunit HslU, partial [Planctomycetes bacterium]|nr:ATP-dependent protease ATPase subunit HslU [Planctomycetota bacterium]
RRVEERLLDLLVPPPSALDTSQQGVHSADRYERTREKMRAMLRCGELEGRRVELTIEQKAIPMMLTGMGMEQIDIDLQGMFEKILPKQTTRREMTVAEARNVLFEQECDALINRDKVHADAVELAENLGIIFVDEIDKVVASEHAHGADVSRQGVQRDLLPIVEGTTVQTRYGFVKTDHILFIAAGAFHRSKPSDLMPELQGRFPIRVELNDLTKEDFVRILKEPKGALTKQYQALLKTECVELVFEDDAVEALATYAYQVNQTTQNIGARRLYTIMERMLEDLSFEAPEIKTGRVVIDAAYVQQRLEKVTQDEDLTKFIL